MGSRHLDSHTHFQRDFCRRLNKLLRISRGVSLIMHEIELCRTILFVKDMTKMVEFYQDSLGLIVTSDEPTEDWTVLSAGSVQLALHKVP